MTDSLGFLIGDVSRAMRKAFDRRVRSLGITRPQWRFLTILSRFEGSNQGALAELLEIEAITLCRMIDRMEEAGLVERRRDPDDRRAWKIYLTKSAHPLIDKLKAVGEELAAATMAGITPEQEAQLRITLESLHANLTADSTYSEKANG